MKNLLALLPQRQGHTHMTWRTCTVHNPRAAQVQSFSTSPCKVICTWAAAFPVTHTLRSPGTVSCRPPTYSAFAKGHVSADLHLFSKLGGNLLSKSLCIHTGLSMSCKVIVSKREEERKSPHERERERERLSLIHSASIGL